MSLTTPNEPLQTRGRSCSFLCDALVLWNQLCETQTWKTNKVISIKYDSYLMSAASHLRLTDEWSHEGGMKQNKVLVFFVQLFVKYAVGTLTYKAHKVNKTVQTSFQTNGEATHCCRGFNVLQ